MHHKNIFQKTCTSRSFSIISLQILLNIISKQPWLPNQVDLATETLSSIKQPSPLPGPAPLEEEWLRSLLSQNGRRTLSVPQTLEVD